MADVFVFGSNKQGRHGKGAAKYALQHHGAIYGVGEGRQGNSYAIPTKSSPWQTLPLHAVEEAVERFLLYAAEHPDDTFNVTPIGCGLAGYSPKDIAPMFDLRTANVILPKEFINYD